MPDARFERLKLERRPRGSPRGVGGERGDDATDLDGISQRRSRAVHLQRDDVHRAHATLAKRGGDDGALRWTVRRGERARTSVLVRRPSRQRRRGAETRVPAGRIRTFEDQRVASVRARVPVRGDVERLASPVRRQHARSEKTGGVPPGEDQVDAGDGGGDAFANDDGARAEMRGDQGRRTRRVDAQRGSHEVTRERHATGRDAQRGGRRAVRSDGVSRRRFDLVVISRRDADENPERAAVSFAGVGRDVVHG